MQKKKILVIGSTNMDMVVRTKKFPIPGETLLGGQFLMNSGGKGANQAVAAKRMGGNVSFLGKTGNDIFGRQAKQLLEKEGIDVSLMCIDPEQPSGVALITVNSQGENSIVVAAGANDQLSNRDVDQAVPTLSDAEFLLLQLEIPLKTVEYASEVAIKLGKKVVLNPAPATNLPDSLLKLLYMITPNETEAEILTGIKITDKDSAHVAALKLKEKGISVVIITMGSDGAFVLSKEFTGMVNAPKVTAIDTTAAGDTFNGALVVALSEGKPLSVAVDFACKAASIAVTRKGAQSSIPYATEILGDN